jgi:hypothetical protein
VLFTFYIQGVIKFKCQIPVPKQAVFVYILPVYCVKLAWWRPRDVETCSSIDIYKKLGVDGHLFISFFIIEHDGMHNFKIVLS